MLLRINQGCNKKAENDRRADRPSLKELHRIFHNVEIWIMDLWNEYLLLRALRTAPFFDITVIKAAFKTRDKLFHSVLQSQE